MAKITTPDECFSNLPDYPFEPHYLTVKEAEGEQLNMHYVDEGPRDASVVLLLHGEPSWSFLYRKMIPIISHAGYRVLAPDLIGFGRSDKLEKREDYTYAKLLNWLQFWLDELGLQDITLFCQDWGGLLGMRLVSAQPERFARVVAANTMLPTGDHDPGEAFHKWKAYSQKVDVFPIGDIIQRSTIGDLPAEVVAGYDAPFPDESFKEAARQLPALVPVTPDNPESQNNRDAWKILSQFTKPWLCTFSDQDPITKGGDKVMRQYIPGCEGQPHVTIKGAGHFLQEDKGEELAEVVVDFIRATQ